MVLSRVLSGVPVRRSLVLFTQNGISLQTFIESHFAIKLDNKSAIEILGSEFEGKIEIRNIVFRGFRGAAK